MGEDAQFEDDAQWCRNEVKEEKFRRLPKDKLIRCINLIANSEGSYNREGAEYRNELTRRATDRQTTWIIALTWVIAILTLVLVVLEFGPRFFGAEH